MLLQIVFDGQVLVMTAAVAGQKRFFFQEVGITTGLSCAVQLANLYLIGSDRAYAYTFAATMVLYRRFVGDILIMMNDSSSTHSMLEVLNSFHPNIVVTNDGEEDDKHVTFLDLDISIADDCLTYSTHRKALASYSYTPFDSNHASSTLLGIVATETVRLLRTNCCKTSFEAQCCFFSGKLKLRGFDITVVRRIMARYPWSGKDAILKRKAKGRSEVLVPLKLPYSPGVPRLSANKIFRSYEHLLPQSLQEVLKPMVSLQTAPNLFRLRYSRFC